MNEHNNYGWTCINLFSPTDFGEFLSFSSVRPVQWVKDLKKKWYIDSIWTLVTSSVVLLCSNIIKFLLPEKYIYMSWIYCPQNIE